MTCLWRARTAVIEDTIEIVPRRRNGLRLPSRPANEITGTQGIIEQKLTEGPWVGTRSGLSGSRPGRRDRAPVDRLGRAARTATDQRRSYVTARPRRPRTRMKSHGEWTPRWSRCLPRLNPSDASEMSVAGSRNARRALEDGRTGRRRSGALTSIPGHPSPQCGLLAWHRCERRNRGPPDTALAMFAR